MILSIIWAVLITSQYNAFLKWSQQRVCVEYWWVLFSIEPPNYNIIFNSKSIFSKNQFLSVTFYFLSRLTSKLNIYWIV